MTILFQAVWDANKGTLEQAGRFFQGPGGGKNSTYLVPGFSFLVVQASARMKRQDLFFCLSSGLIVKYPIAFLPTYTKPVHSCVLCGGEMMIW
jgi:hypothetical protein